MAVWCSAMLHASENQVISDSENDHDTMHIVHEVQETSDLPDAVIAEIVVSGNELIPHATIMAHSCYHVGEKFLPQKSRSLLHSLYRIGLVSCASLEVEEIAPGSLRLHISIVEKPQIHEFKFQGNALFSSFNLAKKLEVQNIAAGDEGDICTIEARIKSMYAEKNYHNTKVSHTVVTDDAGVRTVLFTIDEGYPTNVRRVFFKGNSVLSSRKLRGLTFTREDWVLGFMNRAGSFQPGALEYDRSVIESNYQNIGYLMAQVTDVAVTPVPGSSNVDVTFTISEGDQYVVTSVKAPGTSLFSEQEQLAVVGVRPGQWYSKEMIKQSVEMLRMLFGEYGYIDAEVIPQVVPDIQNKTVAITFQCSLGNQIFLNRIRVIGHKKTDEDVIRRQLILDEGEMITTRKLELSKGRVQSLGFFDVKGGVNWNVVRLNDNQADLELLLDETKTGQFFMQLGFGGLPSDRSSPADGFRVNVGAQNSNWLGRGLQGSLSLMYSKQEGSFDINITDPWLFNRPMYGSMHFFHRRSKYEDFNLASEQPSELTTALFTKLGFSVERVANVSAILESGFEHICFGELKAEAQWANLITRRFQSGDVISVGGSIMQDLRNHPTHPTSGYLANLATKVGIPMQLKQSDFGFWRMDFDTQWYASLIEEYNVVFRFHMLAGFINKIANFAIPYRELYHIGGPATVRGFLFGQIGPQIAGTSLGATRALVLNNELLFPVTRDGSIRGVIFYDGGAGWNTPDKNLIPVAGLRNDSFNYRHAIGLGVRLTQPQPVSIDIGFKLDRRKRFGESLYEVHFSMTRDF